MRSNIINVAVFLVVAVGFWFLLSYANDHWAPKPVDKNAEQLKREREIAEERLREEAEIAARREGHLMAVGSITGWAAALHEPRPKPLPSLAERRKLATGAVTGWAAAAVEPAAPKAPVAATPQPPAQPTRLVQLGEDNYNLKVMLTTHGGAVQQVVLTKFDAANRLGREVKQKDENGRETAKGMPLYLIPGKPLYKEKGLEAEYIPPVLTAGPVHDPLALGEPSYQLFHYQNSDDKYPDPFLGETNWKLVSEEHPTDGEHKVVFEAELSEPFFVKFRKTYTLSPGDYHIGFKLDIEPLPGAQKGKGLRYQLSGPRGLPLEGEWYTTTYRVGLVGWQDKNGVLGRQYDDAASVATKRGGDEVARGDNTFKYMVVATQYMASGVAIDSTAEGAAKNPWLRVRTTTETPLTGQPNADRLNFEDITVRAVSDVVEPGKSITHKYLIYNGPAKVRLLGLMEGDRKVNRELVDRYMDKLDLRTITDFHSPTWIGSFAYHIWWSDLVLAFTNLMHWMLWAIHYVIQSWGASIIVLTVFVRLLLLYPSRKQTQMNLRMMEVQKKLAPQIEELKRRYGDDFNAFNREKMRLMMANGLNPAAQLGGCLLLLFQTPVMMGLYFCLQESIFFRLDHFLWINNMAAPDMTLWWTEKIPFISTPSDLGSFFYLGPYLNILPLMAVGLMIWQQNKMMPPPTDDQMAQQQKMMKFMMIFIALMFYKVAAGLALYFIVGSAWGLIERRYFTKKKEHDDEAAAAAAQAPLPPSQNGYSASSEPEKPKGALGRFRAALHERMEELKRQAEDQSKRQIRNAPDQRGRDKKKKKRK